MKRLSIYLIAFAIGMFGCKDNDTSNASQTSSDSDTTDIDFSQVPELPEQVVHEMVQKWASKPHSNEEIIQQITMDGKNIRSLIKKNDIFKMYTAAYLKDGGGHTEGETTIVISKISKDGKRIFYDFDDFFHAGKNRGSGGEAGGSLCPPPSNCDFPYVSPLDTKKADSTTSH